MALASAPSTPERRFQEPLVRRSFTAPINSANQNLPSFGSDEQKAETLFAHGTVKVVQFSNSGKLARRHSSVSDGKSELHEAAVGTLPWASLTERTIAAGPLRIYRVLGSVAFLSSGNILQPLLAKSQCWCVDGVSKFVLRIRPNSYYRIELPYNTPQDQESVEQLRDVLVRLLQYEATPCPFKRGFTVDLPEPPKTPVRKKPWKPKPRVEPSGSQLPDNFSSLNLEDEGTISQDHALESMDSEVSGDHTAVRKVADFPSGFSDAGSIIETENGADSETTSPGFMQRSLHEMISEEPPYVKTPTRPRRIMTGRTITAPPELSVRTSTTTNSASISNLPTRERGSPSLSSSVDSFHSFHSPISPLSPTPSPQEGHNPPVKADGLAIPRTGGHKRDKSEATITADSHQLWDLSGLEAEPTFNRPHTPTLVSDAISPDEEWEQVNRPSPPGLRIRQNIAKRRRPYSPPPSSTNLYSPYSPRQNMSGHHFTTAILQRTYSLFFGPPVQLLALMLRIAAKIGSGVFKGESFGWGEQGQRIPCSWDFSDGSDAEIWEEDDYGFALGKMVSGKEINGQEVGGSWEID